MNGNDPEKNIDKPCQSWFPLKPLGSFLHLLSITTGMFPLGESPKPGHSQSPEGHSLLSSSMCRSGGICRECYATRTLPFGRLQRTPEDMCQKGPRKNSGVPGMVGSDGKVGGTKQLCPVAGWTLPTPPGLGNRPCISLLQHNFGPCGWSGVEEQTSPQRKIHQKILEDGLDAAFVDPPLEGCQNSTARVTKRGRPGCIQKSTSKLLCINIWQQEFDAIVIDRHPRRPLKPWISDPPIPGLAKH